jgi:ABC-type transport system involved in cytochrome bd biosynthesis fused ATPase/permease subunit
LAALRAADGARRRRCWCFDQPTARLDPRTASDLIEDVFAATGNETVFADHPSQPGLDRVDRVVSIAAHEMTASEIET